jgi:hypothetical protein
MVLGLQYELGIIADEFLFEVDVPNLLLVQSFRHLMHVVLNVQLIFGFCITSEKHIILNIVAYNKPVHIILN